MIIRQMPCIVGVGRGKEIGDHHRYCNKVQWPVSFSLSARTNNNMMKTGFIRFSTHNMAVRLSVDSSSSTDVRCAWLSVSAMISLSSTTVTKRRARTFWGNFFPDRSLEPLQMHCSLPPQDRCCSLMFRQLQ